MKRIKVIISALLLAGIIAISCSEDFLEVAPQASFSQEVLENETGVQAALISAYSMLDGWQNDGSAFQSQPWPNSSSNWIFGSVASDDAHKGSTPSDQPEILEVELFRWAPGNTYFDSKWRAMYEGISRANTALNLLANAEDIANPNPIAAEARFLRAHYHFDLWKLWVNVPYMLETYDPLEKRSNTDDDVISLIIQDLQFAADNLPATQGEIGRASEGAARAYLGKAYLYNQDFANAKQEFDLVVNSGLYELLPSVADIFTAELENAGEHLFSIQASANDGSTNGANGNWGDRLAYPHEGSPFGCCGFHQPSQNLVNAHKTDPNGLPLLDTFDDSDVTITDPVDPRLDWTVGRDDVPFKEWGPHQSFWIRDRNWAGPYSQKKFLPAPGDASLVGWRPEQLSPINVPIIRYADVLLMLAEAEVELGNLERARELVNMVRTRAGQSAIGPDGLSTSLDDSGITWATYNVGTYDDPWTDTDLARKAVRHERRLELALEGHRFFDLKRWGVASEVLNNYLTTEAETRAYLSDSNGFEDRHMRLPIPSLQIELNKVEGGSLYTQNPGY